jgi:Domain of unknown function (DUF4160)
MPTIIRQDGLRIIIYPNDHIPSHVHVIKKGGGEVRIALGSIDPDNGKSLVMPSIISIEHKIRDKDVAKALSLVEENQADLLTKWSEIHAE